MTGRQLKRHFSKSVLMSSDAQCTSSGASRKKRKVEVNSSEEEEHSSWMAKHLGDVKAYNKSSTSETPAEQLFRKDLISAMKLADNEPLTCDDFWSITDPWKQEWEKGVQVPVRPTHLPGASVLKHTDFPIRTSDFHLPGRLMRVTHDDFFNNERHVLSNVPTKAEKMCRYDMDNLDTSWLNMYNGERARMGAEPVPDVVFELIIEHLEETCWENIQSTLKEEEPLSIEFDEDVICDVCRSPDSEEGNEMVFCDICDICVHQACYGITAIPSGPWLCKICNLGIKPNCVLCPNKGGAMKCAKSGHKWAHVACALWIPEVSIGSVERMEPITKITNIPQSRWALVCVLCRERSGACIQCSVKTCKTAYHVTCAFKHGLEMKAIIEDENADDVKLRSYCEKHSRNNKKECSDVDSDGAMSALKKKKDLTKEQKNRATAAKLRQIETEFYKHVDPMKTSTVLDIDFETTETIFYFWKLKRSSVFNKPLLTPRSQEFELLADNKEQDIECMKMFVQLRQYLERVRNLCYMVSRREKLSRSFFKVREQTFMTQVAVLSNTNTNLKSQELEAIIHANHSSSIYDNIYSHSSAPTFSPKEFEQMIKNISGKGCDIREEKVRVKDKSEKRLDINGVIKRRFPSHLPSNPYRKSYLNGAEQRKSRSRSASQNGSTETSSTEDSDSSLASTKWKTPETGKRISVFTSSEDEQIEVPKKSIKNNAKPHLFDFHNQPFKSVDTSDEDKQKVKSNTQSLRGRGRGTVKRGRGRPPLNRKVVKENLFSSEDEKPNKDLKNFDALMKSTTRNFQDSETKVEAKYSCESSEEELAEKMFPNRASKNKVKKNFNAFTSSEDELPAKPPTRGRGRGRGRSRGSASHTSSNSAIYSWLTASKVRSSDDDLAPATYKLTSDEEDKSEGSYKSLKHESEESAKSGSELEAESKTKRVDSESDHVLSGGEGNFLHLRTKGAVKEFTAKPEPFSAVPKKKQVGRPPKKSKGNDKSKTVSLDISKNRSSDPEITCDLNLFVPQRAAAKKASELITSQNSNPSLVINTSQVLEVRSEIETSDVRKITKSVRDSMSESESLSSFNEEAKKSPPKLPKSKKEVKVKADLSDLPKKNIFETPEILPYVPIREAARKAAENLKFGVKLNSLPGSVPEEPDVSTLKPKKLHKIDKTAPPTSSRTLRTKSPRSSSKGSTVSATSETEEESSPKKRTIDIHFAKNRSMFSESDEEVVVKKIPQETVAANKNQLFRGDIYVFDHQSSSEEDADHIPSSSNKIKESYRKSVQSPQIPGSKKGNAFRTSKRVTTIFPDSLEDEHEVENKEPTDETHRKAPDKKLKTSDGRPEHGFQPSITKREESRITQSEDEFPSALTSLKESESRLRKSGDECGQRISSGDVSKTNIRSNSDASPSRRRVSRHQEHNRDEAISVCSPREAEETKSVKDRREVFVEESVNCQNTKSIPEKGFKSTFQCITVGQEEKAPLECDKKNSAVFNFTENEVQVKRLDDIVEASDSELEPKKVKIVDSDDETSSEAKVEQPKDSGYKSSITTPEPNENSTPGILKSSQLPTTDSESTRKKAQVPQVSPEKSNSSKFLTSSRRKNLNDVIEERKKAAEMSECRNISSAEPINSLQRSSTESHYMESDNSETLHEGNQSATESSGRSPSTSNFVEEWRTQWVKSPQPPQIEHPEIRSQWVKSPKPVQIEHTDRRNQWQKSPPHPIHIDHQEPPQPYKGIAHHHPIPIPDYPYIDLQQNLQDNIMYLSHLQMMQYHHYLRQLSVSSKSHESQLEETAEIVRMSHRDDRTATLPIHLNQSSRLSLLDDQLQRVKIPPQVRDDRQILSEAQNKVDSRRTSDIPYAINTSTVAASSKTPDLPNLPSTDLSVSSLHSHTSASKKTEKSYLPTMANYKDLHQTSHVDAIGTTCYKNISKSQIVENLISTDSCERCPSSGGTLPPVFSAKTVIKSSNDVNESPSLLANSTNIVSPKTSVLSGITIGGQSVVSTSTVTTVHSVSTSVTSVSPSLPANVSHTFVSETISDKKNSPEIDVVSTNIGSPTSTEITTVTSKSPPQTATIPFNSISTVSKADEVMKPNKSQIGIDIVNTDSTVICSEPPNSKRIPIYRQEPKIPKSSNKYPSPRSINSTSPRWTKEKKRSQKSTRGKRGRGRGAIKRGRPSRICKVSVPKELIGTVYDFDQFDEFDDSHSNTTLGDLRLRRGKRQSVDTTPQHNFASPDVLEMKASPATKRTREKKPKGSRDKSSKDLTISPLKINLPLSDPLSLDDSKSSSKASYMQERRKSTPSSHSNKGGGDAASSVGSAAIVSSIPNDGINQLRLKIKGPYANACLNSSLPVSQPEASYSSSAVTASATSNLRRMRKKELIQQYCNQDMNVEKPDNSYHIINPPVQRAGISIPKAVASMPHIPTREDYKKYTQDDNSGITSTGRRKKTRELKQLDWSLKEDTGRKRLTSTEVQYPRKRPRIAKENRSVEEKESTKIVISRGKRSPEVLSSSIVETKELSIRGKPPKKRLPDMMMKVKSENLKFREEIMKNFDEGLNCIMPSDDKRSKRRRIAVSSDEKSQAKEQNDFNYQDVKVTKVMNEKNNKLVLTISKNTKEERGSNTPNAQSHPLKMRLNLSGSAKVESSETCLPQCDKSPMGEKLKVLPLKIKLQRRAQGYVTSNCNVKKNTPLDHGPGPPPRPTEPPDLYSKPAADIPSRSQKSGNVRIEHRDRESLTRDDHHSIIPDDVYQQLEAHLAATDGGVVDGPNCPNISQSSFSSLQPVTTIKDNPGCR